MFTSTSHSTASSRDTIRAFTPGPDDVVADAIDANTGARGDQDFRLDRGGAFSAGEIRQTLTWATY